MNSIYDASPFTTYWYYKNATNQSCECCDTQSIHYLLRYRIYLGSTFPIFPTSTTYYLVCLNCDHITRLDKEGDVAKIISRVKGSKPSKYNKYSQMNLEGYSEEEFVAFGTDIELKSKIRLHLNDIAKST